jgi:hypothetical protein
VKVHRDNVRYLTEGRRRRHPTARAMARAWLEALGFLLVIVGSWALIYLLARFVIGWEP